MRIVNIRKSAKVSFKSLVFRDFSLAMIIVLALSVTAYSQTIPFRTQITPGNPAGAYSLGGFDNVNLFNGNINIDFPLVNIGGRGKAGLSISARFQTLWHINAYLPGPLLDEVREPILTGGTTYPGLPRNLGGVIRNEVSEDYITTQDCGCSTTTVCPRATITTLTLTTPDGSVHKFVDKNTLGSYMMHDICLPNINNANRGREFVSVNGEAMTFMADSDIIDPPPPDPSNIPTNPNYRPDGSFDNVPGTLYMADGTRIRYEYAPIWMIDKDGNKTTFSYGSLGSTSSPLITIQDSIGREVKIMAGVEESPYGVIDKLVTKGFGGSDRVIRFKYASWSSSLRNTQSGDVTSLQSFQTLFPGVTVTGTPGGSVISEMILPNGQSYKFKYNEYREVTSIELPTGGVYEYDYDSFLTQTTEFAYGDYRRVTRKRVYDENLTLLNDTEFVLVSSSSPGNVVGVAVRNAASQIQSLTYHYFWGNPGNYYPSHISDRAHNPWHHGREYKTEQWNTSATQALRRVEKVWAQPSSSGYVTASSSAGGVHNNPRVIEEKTTLLDTNQVSKKVFTFDDSVPYANVQEVHEYDWGVSSPGALLRNTHTDYVTSSGYVSPTGAHLRRLPSQKWISSDINGSNKVSLSQFEYDNYASNSTHAPLVSRSSVFGHDTTNYGTGNTVRGNVTALTTYTNAATPSGAITAYSQYDILGNTVKTIDTNGNVSTISYSDNFGSPDSEVVTNSAPSQLSGLSTFAFPTSSTNPLNWTVNTQYDYFLGKMVNTQDENGIISKTIYNDPLDRPTQAVFAINTAEIQSTAVYDDENNKVQITSDLNTLNDNLLKSVSLYDGLGRSKEKRTYEVNGDYKTVQTQYDALGRPYKVSNMFRPTEIDGSHPIQWRESRFDDLGRVYEVETPDGAKLKTSYDGSRTLVTDPGGKKRISNSNALGDLTDVWEITASDSSTVSVTFPGSDGTGISAGYKTSYSYNALGNMIKVSQGVQNRYFMYDSLSRMTRLRQPEQQVNTSLNTSGNPDNNQWTIGVTYDNSGNVLTTTDAKGTVITNTYEALNRVTQRSYSDSTPTVTYTYDNKTYSKGRLTKVASSVSSSEFLTFDPLGRVTRSQQVTDGVVYGTDEKPMTYTFNLAGDLVEQTYASGRKMKTDLDNTGQLFRVRGQKNSASGFAVYADNFKITAWGKIERLQLGNGLWESAKLNSRQQVTELALGVVPSDTSLWKLNSDFGELQTNGSVDAAKNNGDVAKQTTTFSGQSNPYVQTYKYDALDRLSEAKETVNTQQKWIQNYGYDRYGNRTSLNQYIGTVNTTQAPAFDANTNRFQSSENYTYDTAGNVVGNPDGTQFIFDGDNKQVQVKDASNNPIGNYYYDGNGKRVKKVTNTETTIFVYDANGKLLEEYSTQLASVPTVNYTVTDTLGSPRVITDANGKVTSRRDFMPFGEDLNAGVGDRTTTAKYGYGDDNVRKRFTGYERDQETGLDFAEARYYQSKLGRFTAVDPLAASGKSANPQTFNRYVYTMNRPLALTDSSGMQATAPAVPERTFNRTYITFKEVTIPTVKLTATPMPQGNNERDAFLRANLPAFKVEPGPDAVVGREKIVNTNDAVNKILNAYTKAVYQNEYAAQSAINSITEGKGATTTRSITYNTGIDLSISSDIKAEAKASQGTSRTVDVNNVGDVRAQNIDADNRLGTSTQIALERVTTPASGSPETPRHLSPREIDGLMVAARKTGVEAAEEDIKRHKERRNTQ